MPPDPATWYVMIGEQETGPLTRVELGVELASGAITPETLVWKEGMIKWLPGSKVPELQALFKNPPRPPRPGGRPPPPPGARPPPPPKPQAKGEGLSQFDTAHFKLADMAAEESAGGKGGGNLEFDTAHFRLQDLNSEESAASRQMEFDTSHFRLQDLKGAQAGRPSVPKRIAPKAPEQPIELDVPQSPDRPGKAGPRNSIKQASTSAVKPAAAPVAVRPTPAPPVASVPAAKPAAAAARPAQAAIMSKGTARPAGAAKPAAEAGFDPNRTSVDFRTLGALVQKQAAAQSMFESAVIPDEAPVVDEPPPPDPQAEELSKWAAKEIENAHKEDSKPGAPKKMAPPPLPIHAPQIEKSWVPTAIAIAGALALVAALVWYLLSD